MLLNIAIAAFMMVATTAIHAGGMVLALRLFRSQRGQVQKTRIYQLAGTILLMFLVSVLEVPAWATDYLTLNAIQGYERALYFSTVTFTTMDILVQNKKMAIASVIVIGMTFAFTWLPSESCAQVDNNKPAKLLVGTVVAPPFAMKGADGTWEGISIDLWQAVASVTGVQYENGETGTSPISEVLAPGSRHRKIENAETWGKAPQGS